MIEINKFSKEYVKGTKAVDNLSLVVKDGEICAFLGHNGAGKTTTIKSIVGILEVETGTIKINNLTLKDNEIEYKKNIAYVPDNPVLYEYLNATEYLNFIANIYNISVSKRKELITQYAEYFEIDGKLNMKISSYSHGMKQKIALIAALIHEPKVLILDEPFVGLDPVSTYKLKELMKNLAKDGVSILFSTHILEVAEKLCDKVQILKHGKSVYSGSMKDVTKYKSLEELYLEYENDSTI